MDNRTVTGVIGSLRSCLRSETIEDIMKSFTSFDDVLAYIYKLGGDHKISNSEALLLSALYASHEAGLRTKCLRLNDHFSPLNSVPKDPEMLKSVLEQTSGFLLSTPVYFGDRSSLTADLIKFFRDAESHRCLPLDGKAVGVVSVGAKRNGGQETTNIYALYDCMNLGACIVGNGPPISQYGGTGWGGNIGAIIDDNFGLNTSKGTGRRVGLLSKVLSLPETATSVRILFVVTRADIQRHFVEKIKELPFSEDVDVDVLDLSNLNIKRCRACPICPQGNLEREYTCVISPESSGGEKDDMHLVHSRLIKADGIVLAHYAGENAGPDRFQTFMERTRFMRRHDFELTDRAFSVFTETASLHDIYSLRFMTSFLRQNLFIIGPFYIRLQGTDPNTFIESIPVAAFAERIEMFTKKTRLARKNMMNTFASAYEPIGYPVYMQK